MLTRFDPELDFDWPWSPGEGVSDDYFSIRWSGFLKPLKSFDGWIGLSSDDGIRMWINDDLVIDNWDVATLYLQGKQQELIQAIQQTGTTVVCVLLNGRPLSVNWIDQHIPAIVEAWFPGEAGGRAVADVLFGDYNPAGRLPVTFLKSAGQLPIYYNQKPSAIHRYVTESDKPLYPFGYGLSYTTFKYSDLTVEPQTIQPDEKVKVTVEVKNTGTVDGEEVVQLYLRDVYSSVTTPWKTLKGFQRIALKAGETKRLVFELAPEELSIWNREMKKMVEPGKFRIMVGGNSADLPLKETFTVVDETYRN